MNGELLCELVRAHYDSDITRFDVLVRQIIDAERLTGSAVIADRLADIIHNASINRTSRPGAN